MSRQSTGPEPPRDPAAARQRPGLSWWAARVAPLAVLAVVIAVDLTARRNWTLLELLVLCPLVAATLVQPRLTIVYAALAVVSAVLLGLDEDLYSPQSRGLLAQFLRVGGVAIGGVIAILVSVYHARRERKLRTVTHVAQVAQLAILAPVAPVIDGVRLAGHYESAAREATVGGDLYEATESPWGLRLIIGDVRGKGLDAVHLASRVLGGFRMAAARAERLSDIVADLDTEVAKASGLDDFVTAAVIQIKGRRLTLVNAGHPDPILLEDDTARPLAPAGRQPPLGLGADGTNTIAVSVRPGSRLLLYTDGLAEARNPGTGGFIPLLPCVRGAFAHRPLDDGLGELVRQLRDWTENTLNDDVALIAVEIPGPDPPA
ncbi:serine/threonine-protein phosphatase [Frankia sp. AgB1.9]|uniref:PP2C family protein-serine/threonine phosphatase n=1 Tax=unclassified Frankia TaxID=2632575 RepID=UPI0019348D08|nr:MULTISPECIES: PP2C family protein-serine/threonine phosphatase [unclassified Frankia]MBL7487676.1 serine/threonine-protein phosphatase [Frankia sp. AgW1.1]MBL7550054.1 serine/threonine-protein phosphatase [Frankia sp. AgB1.9]MBL7621751.1 serine/threonine-protein phosphatase [Frankia sp. AgB1.8]